MDTPLQAIVASLAGVRARVAQLLGEAHPLVVHLDAALELAREAVVDVARCSLRAGDPAVARAVLEEGVGARFDASVSGLLDAALALQEQRRQ